MSMRSDYEFALTNIKQIPIPVELLWQMLDQTSYSDHYPDQAFVSADTDYEYFWQPEAWTVTGRFLDVHPEEFPPAFIWLSQQLPDCIFAVHEKIEGKTEMVEAGETKWFLRNGKVVSSQYGFELSELLMLYGIIGYVSRHWDDFLATGNPAATDSQGKIQVELTFLSLCRKFSNAKDVF